MAGQTINVNLKMTTQGMDKASAAASQIHEKLEKANTAAAKTSKTLAAVKAASAPAEYTEYGRTRAMREGGTGASARDFANQAQGLGGLVRLYATYAANIFAVSAAFNALSAAMDTTNMIKGLNQLGAASGTALGNLSKELVAATDGAVSLREAMEATVKASSSGMSNKDIIRMGEAAQKASLALGVNMSDALSRMSRGITKLEPELLDELGLFVRVDDAASEYAKTVGKTASELTGFERRMAFANATLEQAEKKFGAIDIESNPYTQLLAELKNFAQAAGEVMNVALVPLVKLLSSSPLALTTVIGGLAAVLLKQAVPAFGQLRDSLKASADEAAQIAKARAEEAISAKKNYHDEIVRMAEAEAEKRVQAVDRAEKQIQKIDQKGLDKRTSVFKALQKTSDDGILTLKDSDFAAMDASVSRMAAAGETEKAAAHAKVVETLKSSYKAEQDYLKIKQESIDSLEKYQRSSLAVVAARNAEAVATSKQISSNAAYNASVHGLRFAFVELGKEIGTSQLTTFQKFKTGVVGGFSAIAGKIGAVISAFSGLMMGIGVVLAAVGMLDMVFSKASKEIEAFDGTIEKATGAAESFDRTIKAVYKNTAEGLFDVAALKAYGNALQEIADTAELMGSKFKEARDKMSFWDKAKDWTAGLFGADMADDLADGMTSMLESSMRNVKTPQEAEALRTKLAQALNLGTAFSVEEFNAAVEKAADSKNYAALEAVGKAFKGIAMDAQIAASKVDDFESALGVAKDAFKEFADQYKTKDPTQKLGESIIGYAKTMSKALEDPRVAIQQLYEISQDSAKLALFDSTDQQNILKYKDKIVELRKQQEEYNRSIKDANDKLKQLEADRASAAEKAGYVAGSGMQETPQMQMLSAQIEAQKKVVQQNEKALAGLAQESKTLLSSFDGITGRSFQKGANLIAASIEAAAGSAGAEIKKGIASGLGDLSGAAKLQADAARADLSAKASLIQVQLAQVEETRKNTMQMKLLTLAQELATSNNLEPGERARFGMRSPDAIKQEMDLIKQYNDGGARSIRELGKLGEKAGMGQIASDLIQFTQATAGLRAELGKIGAQQQVIKLDEKAKTLAEESRAQSRLLDIEKQKTETSLTGLANLEKTQGYITEAQREERKALQLKKADLEYQQESLKLTTELAQQEIYLNEMKKQARSKADIENFRKAEEDFNNKKLQVETALQQKQNASEAIKADFAADSRKRKLEEFNFTQETLNLQNQINFSREEAGIAEAQMRLQMVEAEGLLSDTQMGRYKLEVMKLQESANLKKRLYEMEIAYIRQVQELALQATPDNAASIQERIRVLNEAWQQNIANITKESNDKIMLETFKVEQSTFADLKAGLSDAISTALFEGGEAGKKKLRDVIVAELKKPITLFINAMVNSLFSGGSAGGKNSPTNFMDMFSDVTKKYGNYVSQFGDLIGSANTSAFGTGMQLTATETAAAANAYLSAGPEYAGIAESLQAGNAAGGAMGTAGAYAGGIAAGVYGGRAISGGYSALGGSSGNTAVNVGTAIGAFFGPLGAAVGGLIGGVVNRAFGKKLTETGYAAQFNKDGSITASNYEQYKGGWFSSDKTKRTEMDPAAKSALETQMLNLKNGAKGMAEMLGLGSEAIDSFTGEMRVNFKGAKDDAEKAKRVEEAYRKAKAQMLATAHINEAGHVKQKELEATQNSIREQAMRDAEMKIREASKETGKSAAEIEKDVSSASDKIEEAGSTALDNLTEAGTAMENLSQEQLNNINMLRDAEQAKSKEFEDLTNHYVEVIKKADAAMAAAGISAESLGSIIRDAMLGRISGEEAGQALSDQILDGIYNTIASGYANQIGAMIIEQIVQPIFVSIMQTGTISATVSQASIDATINTAMAAVNAFKQILDDPRFQAAMQQLSGAMSQIGKVAGSSAGSIRTRTSSMSYLNNRANEAAEAAKKRAEERLALEKELLGLLGETGRLREMELKEVDAANRALKRQIWAIEDAKEAVEKAMDTLERSIDKRREALQEELELATEARDKVKDVFDTLKENIDDLLGVAAKDMKASEAKQIITQAISTGILPDSDKLSDAIGVLRDKLENDTYVSKTDQKRASIRLANELSLLKGVAEPQLTEAEKTVKALEDQITQLDKQLELAQLQVDALFGIDNSVFEVAVAVDRLNTAMTGYQSQLKAGGGMVGVAPKPLVGPVPDAPLPTTGSVWTAEGYWKNNPELRNYYNANMQAVLGQYGSRDAFLQWHYDSYGMAEGRKYANGGMYPGGMALVGERGPELINFREPGMVYTAAQTRNLMSGEEAGENAELIKELIEEIKMLRYEAQATASHTNKTHRLLDRVTRNGKAVLTEPAPV